MHLRRRARQHDVTSRLPSDYEGQVERSLIGLRDTVDLNTPGNYHVSVLSAGIFICMIWLKVPVFNTELSLHLFLFWVSGVLHRYTFDGDLFYTSVFFYCKIKYPLFPTNCILSLASFVTQLVTSCPTHVAQSSVTQLACRPTSAHRLFNSDNFVTSAALTEVCALLSAVLVRLDVENDVCSIEPATKGCVVENCRLP